MSPSLEVLRLVEDVNAYIPVTAGAELVDRPGYVVWLGTGGTHPELTVVQRFRLEASEVEATVAEIRALLETRERPQSTWEIGPSATPCDLVERLLTLGLVPYPEPVAAMMVLEQAPTAAPSDVVVRRAETDADYLAALEISSGAFGHRAETDEERRERAVRRRAREASGGPRATWLAFVDDEPVSVAAAVFMPEAVVLLGGGTLPRARGRGAYRALVAARAEEGARRGTPTVVVQAGPMSRPILERIGFTTVGEIRVLLDSRS